MSNNDKTIFVNDMDFLLIVNKLGYVPSNLKSNRLLETSTALVVSNEFFEKKFIPIDFKSVK